MRPDWNKKYTTITVYAVIASCITVLVIFFAVHFSLVTGFLAKIADILNPIVIGLILAYLLNPLVRFFENRVFRRIAEPKKKKPHPRLCRALSILAAFLSVALLLALFLLGVVPQVISAYEDLLSKYKNYISSISSWIRDLISRSDFLAKQYEKLISFTSEENLEKTLSDLLSSSFDIILNSSSAVFGFFRNFVQVTLDVIIGIVLSIYLLNAREKMTAGAKRFLSVLLPDKTRETVYGVLKKTDERFGGFIIGKIIDSLIIGVLTLAVTWIFRIPYYPLISVIIAVTNVIPVFGPFIGAIPSAFIIFVADPGKALLFVVLIVLIQQLDGNVIGPKILGSRTGLSALGVVVAITVMGGLLGITGMFIGVPTFAVLYALIRDAIDRKLEKDGNPVSLSAYADPAPSAPTDAPPPDGQAPSSADPDPRHETEDGR